MTTSGEIKEIAGALVAAQGELKNAPFNAKNPHLGNRFANLTSVRDTVVPVLQKHGIAVAQGIGYNGRPHVTTRLMHTSGQWIESVCPLPEVADMQKLGSAITYARRYALSAICGIASEEDDDGNSASGSEDRATTPKPPAGYDQWILDMEVAAKDGQYAEQFAATHKARPELTNYITAHDAARHAKLKTKSAGAKK